MKKQQKKPKTKADYLRQYWWMGIPLVALIDCFLLSQIAALLREPSDFAVLLGVLGLSVLVFVNFISIKLLLGYLSKS